MDIHSRITRLQQDLVLIEEKLAGMYEDGFENWDYIQVSDDHDHEGDRSWEIF